MSCLLIVLGVGNATACAEFNFHADPEAAHIVLNSLKCPINIVPWECCTKESINISKVIPYFHFQVEIMRLNPIILSQEWRFKSLENSDCRNVQLLNEIDEICYRNEDCFIPCDAFLTAIFLFPEKCIQRKGQYQATVELHGNHTRGQVVIDHREQAKFNITVVETLNEEEFKKVFYWTATS